MPYRGGSIAPNSAAPGLILGDPENLFRTEIYRVTLLGQWTVSIERTHLVLRHDKDFANAVSGAGLS